MLWISLSLVLVIIIALEVPGLIRNKKRKELIAFTVLLVLGMMLTITVALDKKIPTLTDITDYIF